MYIAIAYLLGLPTLLTDKHGKSIRPQLSVIDRLHRVYGYLLHTQTENVLALLTLLNQLAKTLTIAKVKNNNFTFRWNSSCGRLQIRLYVIDILTKIFEEWEWEL